MRFKRWAAGRRCLLQLIVSDGSAGRDKPGRRNHTPRGRQSASTGSPSKAAKDQNKPRQASLKKRKSRSANDICQRRLTPLKVRSRDHIPRQPSATSLLALTRETAVPPP